MSAYLNVTPPPLPAWPVKDPADDLNYGLDFTSQMTIDNDTLSSVTSVSCVPTGLTIAQITPVGSIVTFRVTGGVSGYQYTLTAVIETTGGNTFSRSATLSVSSR
jgi:hypothetical protein